MSHEPSHSTEQMAPPPAQAEEGVRWFAVIGTGLGALIVLAIATWFAWRYMNTREKALQPQRATPVPTELGKLEIGIVDQVRFNVTRSLQVHPAVSMVLGPDGRISRYLYGVELSLRDLRLTVVEASQGKVGTTLDRVLLRCFKYDAASRKYHVYVMGVLQYDASFFGAALCALLGLLWWREVKHRKGSAA